MEKMVWTSSVRSSRLHATPVAVTVVLWSLPLFHFTESHMCGTIDHGSCIRRVLDFGIKTGYDSSFTICFCRKCMEVV
jgi:hypothetical protein